jgi:deoxyadenosine/deoxycytidine kinase
VYEDAEIFALNLYQQKLLSERDYLCYRGLYEGIRAFLPPPDLLIYLQAPVGKLVERIASRGRDFERSISINYLSELNKLYDSWIDTCDQFPVLKIATAEMDFVHNRYDLDQIITELRTALREIKPAASI